MIALVENAMPGFETAIRNAGPLVDSFSRGLGTLGTGIGSFFAELTKGTPGAVAGMDALFKLTQELLTYLGQLAANLANVLGPAFAALEPSIMTIVRALGDGLLRIAEALAPHIGRLGNDIANLLTAALDALLPVVEAILPFLAEFASIIMEGLTPVLRELGPVLATVARELVEGLRPILPVIVEHFKAMAPIMIEIGRTAGPLLADIIRTLAPLFLELVKATAELVQAIAPLIPPILELARNAMPVLAGVINDVVIPAIKFLVTEFVGLIDYGVKLAESFAQLSQRWRTYWEEIKAAFADANAKITAGIEGFARLPEIARQHWDAMYQAIKTKITEIVAEVKTFPQRATEAIGNMAEALVAKGREFINGFLQGAKDAFQAVLDWVAQIPSMVLGAIGDTSKTLYNSGASLIDGFNKGIESKVAASREAGLVAVDAASNPFPQSPAKEGPFSGTGWTFPRGVSTIQGFIDGIMSMVPQLKAQVSSIMGEAQSMITQVQSQVRSAMSDPMGALNSILPSLPPELTKYADQAKALASGAIAKGGTWSDPRFGSATVAPGGQKIELQVAPGADSALSSMLMNLVRTGQLQLQKAGVRF